jgi:hypothetical protein
MLILILACLNYLNLISAYSLKREGEVWIRKVNGASPGNIANYFIIESVILSIIAWGFATLISMLGLRIFQNLMGIVISPAYFKITIGFGLFIHDFRIGDERFPRCRRVAGDCAGLHLCCSGSRRDNVYVFLWPAGTGFRQWGTLKRNAASSTDPF